MKGKIFSKKIVIGLVIFVVLVGTLIAFGYAPKSVSLAAGQIFPKAGDSNIPLSALLTDPSDFSGNWMGSAGRLAEPALFFLVVGLWIVLVIYLFSFDEVQDYFYKVGGKIFGASVETSGVPASNLSLKLEKLGKDKMDTTPLLGINDHRDELVSIGKNMAGGDFAKNTGEVDDVYTPKLSDYGIKEPVKSEPKSNSSQAVKFSGEAKSLSSKNDSLIGVNVFINMLARGDEKDAMDYLAKVRERGGSIEKFIRSVIIELDIAYRARREGETNRHNLVFSQIISHWKGEKIEEVIAILFGVLDKSYSRESLSAKLAVMRIVELKD